MPTQDLVLIPGLASDGALWRKTIDVLGGSARCTVGDTLQDSTLRRMTRRILEQAPPKFALAGVSMGGIVASELMNMAPTRVLRLALINTAAAPDNILQSSGRRIISLLAEIPGVSEAMTPRSTASMVHADTPDEVKAQIVAMSLRIGPEVFARQNRAVARRRDLRATLSGIATPTAIIVGRQDTKVPLRYTLEINRLVRGSTLETIEQCGHLPPIEQPAAVVNVLKRWLVREA